MQAISHSIKDTNKVAQDLAKKVVEKTYHKHAVVVALEGELGVGKTTFVKAFARALGIKAHITSPTFVLLKKYEILNIKYETLFHVDAYRLKNYHDLLPLGMKEIIADPKNIILIEWSERIKPVLPKSHIKIHIDHVDLKTRKIIIS